MKFTSQSLKKKTHKKMEPFERSTLQLVTVLNRNEETDTINSVQF